MSVFSQELRRLRIDLGYTAAELARRAEVSAAYVSQLENGKRHPTPSVIRKLSKALGIHPNKLFKTVSMVEMDLAGAIASHREQVAAALPSWPEELLDELASFLTYLDFKSSVLG